ncbi:MAG: glycosyltransferase family 4 protein [Mucilaginibacter sp.]|uniref:glycosyltransferase family 4 protein n=1 Tax=Mucilaginibacter sp. TaxID=1882438 RepID=UPI0034E49A78
MKILFILPEYYPHSGGGISTYYLELIPALKPYCTSIKVLVGSGYTQSIESFTNNGIEVSYLKPDLYKQYLQKFSKFSIFPELQKNIAAAWAMWEQVKDEDFDLIECTDFGLGFIPWLIHHNKPVAIKMHGSTGQISNYDYKPEEQLASDFVRQTELLFFAKCNLLQTYSKANQAFWQKQIQDKEVVQLYPVYSKVTKTIPYSERTTFGLVTGRIQQWKGPQILCDAAEILKDKMPEVHWYGRDMAYKKHGASMNEYLNKQYPDNWNISIKTNKPVPNQEIHNLQAKAKFGLIPSTWDMFNFTCLEFLSAGTLTICSDGAGASELIENGVNGFKYTAQDAQALSEVLNKVASLNQKEYEQIANNGKETVCNSLSPKQLIPAHLEYYFNTIKKFIPTISNDFLNEVYLPSNRKHKLDDLLDLQQLSLLLKYNLKRIKNKILNKFN